MGMFKDIEEAREYFSRDRYAVLSGITVDEMTEDGSVCSMPVTDDHRNSMGGVMGGAIFTLADVAAAVAVNNVHRTTIAMNANIYFLSGTKGTRLFAKSRIVKTGRTTSVAEVTVTDDLGKEIALFTSTGFKL